ncbi:MAG: membrane protein insertion efficiency factor YidD [Candidatus Sungiibacteriota bacterium]|uniref:Putative membrane protein insertion efficiency factor n=1 Tax=Candidatus Sungiibacteriota bacterium TaxID=2750080 RepID=A0A7T5URR1_9BACT|nr:MAG: membrane protein insertion efficiency factor YidD [Candidatus Sungbacteria bacterium]
MKISKKHWNEPLARFVLTVITFYQKTISPDHGAVRILPPSARCRFYPSCSDYARQAIRQYGLIKGVVVSVRRILRCHPGNAGGYDPVRDLGQQ